MLVLHAICSDINSERSKGILDNYMEEQGYMDANHDDKILFPGSE